MKRKIFYLAIVSFYCFCLLAIFSFTSAKVKNNGAIKETPAIAASVTSTENNATSAVENEVLTVEDHTSATSTFPKNLPGVSYRPGDEIAARAIYGTASYYNNMFIGRKTSNGEIFSQQKMTGASNFLPLNEWVRVTNLDNGKSVIVKITDRTHPRIQRVIDLSKSAAKQLSYIGEGLAKVKIEQLGKTKPTV